MDTFVENSFCRCCSSEGTFKDVSTRYHWMGEEEIYADMLKQCFNIILLTSQENRGGICELCISQLRSAANFKKQVLHTEIQFKKILENKQPVEDTIEFVIKSELETQDGDVSDDNDNVSDTGDPDYVTPDFDASSVKEETEEPPRPTKRAAQPSTSRAKKTKTEQPETSAKRHAGSSLDLPKLHIKEEADDAFRMAFRKKHMPEMKKQWHNLTTLLKYSNTTPFKDKNDAGFICAYCFKTYPDPESLRSHTSNDHVREKPTYKASSGVASFVVFLDIVDLKCSICNHPMEGLRELAKHLVQEHKKTYYLDATDYFQPFKLSNTQRMKCCLCDETYHNMKLLMQHMNVHYRNFICTTCGAGFVNSFRLNRHETTHAKKKSNFPCRFCEQVFCVESKRKAHVNTEHKGIAGDSVCQICKARFKNYYQKTRHMVQEHNMEGIKCDLCERKFNLKSNLVLHMRSVHLKERPYECSVCSMGFFIKRHMMGHYLANHTNERKFKCEICGKAYATQNSKRKHMRKNHGITKNTVMISDLSK